MRYIWHTAEEGIRYREHPERKHGVKPDKYFVIRYRVNGKRVEEALGWGSKGWTLQKARVELIKLQEGIRLGTGPSSLSAKRQLAQKIEVEAQKAESKRPTIAKLWEVFKEGKATNRSLDTDIIRYSKHIKPLFENMIVDELNVCSIDTLRKSVLSKGMAPQTVKNILSLLRRIIRFGEQKELCEVPKSVRNIKMPIVDNVVTEHLTSEQIKALLYAMEKEPDQQAANAMRLALCTGMRKTAILSLRWEDVDFERSFIILQGAIAKKKKTEHIPMPDAARAIFASISRADSPFVFPDFKNLENHRNYCYTAFRRIREAAGLSKNFRPMHGLRHTFASILASSGQVDMLTLQKLLSHESPQMTQRYAHLADQTLRHATSVADNYLTSLTLNKE